jgi:SAM-dependent methyltransferase
MSGMFTPDDLEIPSDFLALMAEGVRLWPDDPGKVLLRVGEAYVLRGVEWQPPVLDLGCGNGEFASLINRQISVGMDTSAEALNAARTVVRYDSLVAADATCLPFERGAFGTVVSNSVIEHVQESGTLLSEVARVLRPGGFLVLTTPTPLKRDWLHWPAVVPAADFDYATFFDLQWEHVKYRDPHFIPAELEGHGLHVTRMSGYESQSASEVIDLLRALRVSVRSTGDSQADFWLKQAWERELTARLAYIAWPVFCDSGAGTLVLAERI